MSRRGERIAIVGAGIVFPGASDLRDFWELVREGRSAARQVPEARWALAPQEAFSPLADGPPALDKVYSLRGCFLDEIPLDPHDRSRLGGVLDRLDPVCHLTLAAARRAVDSAGGMPCDPARIGLIAGNIALPTEAASQWSAEGLRAPFEEKLFGHWSVPGERWDAVNRFVTSWPAGFAARTLGLGRGSATLDAACASSLYAIKLAADELLEGRADAMLAGGVSRPDCLYTQMGFSQLRALSPSGVCRPFDARADGLVVGEGAGLFVLRRLSDAVRSGERILGVLVGWGLSNDRGGRLLAPSSEGQLRALRDAYQASQWRPSDVDLIECHATGTPVGDAVEFASLAELWKGEPARRERCVIGGVKSNVGHLLTAAGAAGLAKVLCALERRELPPTANFGEPNPKLDLDQSPFEVLAAPRPWDRARSAEPRKAAVNAFGFGGINAHLLVEEFDEGSFVPGSASLAAEGRPAIAVVALAARFAGADGPQRFENAVLGDVRSEIARPRRWWGCELLAGDVRGRFFDELAVEADRLRIPPREIEEMLPQQLLMLDVALSAAQSARGRRRSPHRTGVFLGLGLDLCTTNFHFRWTMPERARAWAKRGGADPREPAVRDWVAELTDAASPPLTANRTMGALAGVIASRIARELELGGPSFALSCEEASAFAALETAARALERGELDAAIVGAVDLAGDPRLAIPAKTSAAGPGEGAAAVVLKRLDDALADGDHVHALLSGFGRAGGGDPAGEETSLEAVAASLDQALAEAGVADEDVVLLDRCSAGSRDASSDPPAGAGARFPRIEDYVGNAGAAAAMASLARAVRCLERKILPSSRPQAWVHDAARGPRRAAVAAAGSDGNVHHVVVQEHRDPERDPAEAARRRGAIGIHLGLFAVEGDDEQELRAGLDEMRSFLKGADSAGCFPLAREWHWRNPLDPSKKWGAAFVASSRDDALVNIEAARRAIDHVDRMEDPLGRRDEWVAFTREPLGPRGELAFVFPGSGSHRMGMARELGAAWPEIVAGQDRWTGQHRTQVQPERFWNVDGQAGGGLDHRSLILAQVAIGAMTSDLIRAHGIEPAAAIGYSLGESAALVALGAWPDRDELHRRLMASELFTTELAGPCRAARRSLGLSDEEAFEWLAGWIDAAADDVRKVVGEARSVHLLFLNGPRECVIGGERGAVRALVRELGCTFHPLEGVSTVHCPLAAPVVDEYRALHDLPTRAVPEIRFYASAFGEAYVPTRQAAARAMAAQALAAVDFVRVIEQAHADGVRIFVEVGPGTSTSRMIRGILGDRPHLARPSGCGTGDEVGGLLGLFAHLLAHRVPVDLSPLFGEARMQASIKPGRIERIPVRGEAPTIPRLPEQAPVRPAAPASRVPAPVAARGTTSASAGTVPMFLAWVEARAAAHESFLRFSASAAAAMGRAAEGLGSLASLPLSDEGFAATPEKQVALDRRQCLEFAIGRIGAVLGEEFKEVDDFPTRVRLPDEPLMLVDRIVSIEGTPRSLGAGRVVTEHDILEGGWYLDGGRIPTSIAVEAGQADLFLSAYLGIDFVTRGEAVYRLLDAVVTFHRGLPEPGAVIRYDIRIDRFFRQGSTHLFRFEFEGTAGGEPLLTMRSGCAGFFSEEELRSGKGVVRTELDLRPRPGKLPVDWRPLAPIAPASLDASKLERLRAGDLAAAFGSAFAGLGLARPFTLPSGRLRLLDRVTELDPAGGRFGIGSIRAEYDVHPDDWFLTCHFIDDQVMPGTLMYECALHALRIYLLRLGWIGEEGAVHAEPLPGVASRLKCRGQVTAATKVVAYEVEIKELGYGPEPFAIADCLMYADGKAIVEITDMSLRIAGLSREELEARWRGRDKSAAQAAAVYSKETILAFSNGKPSEAFGEPYRVFDRDRVIARLPGPPYQFLDRIVAVEGAPFRLAEGAACVAEYDVPPEEWYFSADRRPEMPFAVLLEVALQPCGWLAAYCGSALASPIDLSFRNLGGTAVQLAPVAPDAGTLRTRAKLTKVAHSGGMIIQHYDFEVGSDAGPIYEGTTNFGFFTKDALRNQAGVRDESLYQPTDAELARARRLSFPRHPPFSDERLAMVDRIECFVLDGGPRGLGYLRGEKDVRPEEWFFKAHFFQDPVQPGSLGVEALLELLRLYAHERWGESPGGWHRAPALDTKHDWMYRGQVLPDSGRVTLEAEVTEVDDRRGRIAADGRLAVAGKVIYKVSGLSLERATRDS